jgi:hypothetical protein
VEPATEDLERLLRAARPTPRPEFVRELEAALPGRVGRRPPLRARRRVLFTATGFAGALAGLALLLGVAGVLPVSSQRGQPAQADDPCRTVIIERRERQPVFEKGPDGEIRLRFVPTVVPRPVKRCP